jgi:hypothetical protein
MLIHIDMCSLLVKSKHFKQVSIYTYRLVLLTWGSTQCLVGQCIKQVNCGVLQ